MYPAAAVMMTLMTGNFIFLKTEIYVNSPVSSEGAGAIVQYMNTNVNGGDGRLPVPVRRKSNKSCKSDC